MRWFSYTEMNSNKKVAWAPLEFKVTVTYHREKTLIKIGLEPTNKDWEAELKNKIVSGDRRVRGALPQDEKDMGFRVRSKVGFRNAKPESWTRATTDYCQWEGDLRLGGGDYDGPQHPRVHEKSYEFPWKSSGLAGSVMRRQH